MEASASMITPSEATLYLTTRGRLFCFSYKISNKNVASVWKNLSYTLVGETLTEEKTIRANINGITISPKKNFCIIKIWLATCEYQNPKVIGEIVGGITSQGCLFKKHM